jgi:hypothetical protein
VSGCGSGGRSAGATSFSTRRPEISAFAGDKNFAIAGSQHLGIDLDFKRVAAICLEENGRRLAPYDSRLIQPLFVRALARLAMRFMRV